MKIKGTVDRADVTAALAELASQAVNEDARAAYATAATLVVSQEDVNLDYYAQDDITTATLKQAVITLAEDQDDLDTLIHMLGALRYFMTKTEYGVFVLDLPKDVLDKLDPPDTEVFQEEGHTIISTQYDSTLAKNLQHLGYVAYMAMADLGFITLEDMINAAKIQLQGNGTKA